MLDDLAETKNAVFELTGMVENLTHALCVLQLRIAGVHDILDPLVARITAVEDRIMLADQRLSQK